MCSKSLIHHPKYLANGGLGLGGPLDPPLVITIIITNNNNNNRSKTTDSEAANCSSRSNVITLRLTGHCNDRR
jgi:hypothetical protein